jgi:hypothetical protein
MAAVRTTRLFPHRAPGVARAVDAIAHVPPGAMRLLRVSVIWVTTLLDGPPSTNQRRPPTDEPSLLERYLR